MGDEAVPDNVHDVRFLVPITQRPYSSIVRLRTEKNSSKVKRGTGFLVIISARLVIVTAGHCLKQAKKVTVIWPNKETEKHLSVYPNMFRRGTGDLDYGVILLNEIDVPENLRDHFTLLVSHSPQAEENHSILVSGYPRDVHLKGAFPRKDTDRQYAVHLTNPKQHTSKPYLLYYDPTSGGMSGGPVFYKCGQHSFSFGIHIRGFETKKDQENYTEVDVEMPQILEPSERSVSTSQNMTGQPETQPQQTRCEVDTEDEELKRFNVALLMTKEIIDDMKFLVGEMVTELAVTSTGNRTSGVQPEAGIPAVTVQQSIAALLNALPEEYRAMVLQKHT